MQTLELLAPAKNLECGIAAIDHGADAVYIGAPRFGARAAAGMSYRSRGYPYTAAQVQPWQQHQHLKHSGKKRYESS